jgi:hypothetical protein
MSQHNADWDRLRAAARGQDVLDAECLVRDWADAHASWLAEVDVLCMARVLSAVHWARKNPVSALAVAARHRGSRPPYRCLLWLWRPRFAG